MWFSVVCTLIDNDKRYHSVSTVMLIGDTVNKFYLQYLFTNIANKIYLRIPEVTVQQ